MQKVGGTWVTCRGHVSVGNVSKWSSLLLHPGVSAPVQSSYYLVKRNQVVIEAI